MNTITFGIRNAFRNATRAISIIIILGLSIGLSLVMAIAHHAVGRKISDVKSSIGNTIIISPAGFSAFSQANNALTTAQLAKVGAIAHITRVSETLTDRLTTIGSAQPSFGRFSSSPSDNNQTSLASPITLDGKGIVGGRRLFINGAGELPSNFSPPISIVGTNDPATLDGTALTINQGQTINGASNTNDTLISSAMASKNNLKVGSTFTAYGKTLTVSGIFTTTNRSSENTIIVSLPAEQNLSGQSGDVTGAVATVDSVDNLSTATSAIKNTLGSSADVTNSQDQVNQTVQPLNNVRTISLYSVIGAVIAGSVITLLTMIMIVRERRREIGILKAIGGSNLRIIFQFMSEALTLTVLGAVIGLIIGVAGGNPVTNTLVTNSVNAANTNNTSGLGPGQMMARPGRFGGGGGFGARPVTSGGFFRHNTNSVANSIRDIHANVGWNVLGYGLGATLVIAAVGSSFAGWLIARVRPSEVMRAE